MLDEPASNLHPMVQRKLVNLLTENKNAQFIMITHSPYFLSSTHLKETWRFYRENGETKIVKLRYEKLDEKIVKEFERSTDVKAFLFSKGSILVEGETEYGAIPIWDEKERLINLEENNIWIYFVGGYTNLKNYIKFLDEYHIPYVALVDKSKGNEKVEGWLEENFGKDYKKRGIFYLDKTFEELIPENFYKEAEKEVGDSKVRIGRYCAEKIPAPKEIKEFLEFARQRILGYEYVKTIHITY